MTDIQTEITMSHQGPASFGEPWVEWLPAWPFQWVQVLNWFVYKIKQIEIVYLSCMNTAPCVVLRHGERPQCILMLPSTIFRNPCFSPNNSAGASSGETLLLHCSSADMTDIPSDVWCPFLNSITSQFQPVPWQHVGQLFWFLSNGNNQCYHNHAILCVHIWRKEDWAKKTVILRGICQWHPSGMLWKMGPNVRGISYENKEGFYCAWVNWWLCKCWQSTQQMTLLCFGCWCL